MKVLIVDDEPLVRRSLARALKSRGHEIAEAADGVAGLAAWKSGDPDLVFLDVLMPGLTGPEVLREMKERRAKVILMSAFAGETGVSEAAADLFLPKPFEDIFKVVEIAEGLRK